MAKKHEEINILAAPKKITRVAVKKISKDDLYKEYVKLYKQLLMVQDECKRSANNNAAKQLEVYLNVEDLRNENQQLYKEIEQLKDTCSRYYKERCDYKDKSERLNNENVDYLIKISNLQLAAIDKQHNARGAGRKYKFSKEQEQQIKHDKEAGKSIRQLAKEYGCSIGLIHNIIKR